MALMGERDELTIIVQEVQMTNEELAADKSNLTTEKDRLQAEKDVLAGKVNVASSVKVNEISAVGYRVKTSGKESDTKKANNIDGIKVCFNTTSNIITEAGTERFYLRIINPRGEVMAIEDLGSGSMMLGNSHESIRYTQYVEMDYENAVAPGCINWQPGIAFESGKYEVEIYNKGFMSGKAAFVLK